MIGSWPPPRSLGRFKLIFDTGTGAFPCRHRKKRRRSSHGKDLVSARGAHITLVLQRKGGGAMESPPVSESAYAWR